MKRLSIVWASFFAAGLLQAAQPASPRNLRFGGPSAPTVGQCDGLAPSGTWEQITPPQILGEMPGPGSCTFGTGNFVLDPSNSGTVYLGTCNMGIWKTTDCGANWGHVNTGTNGAALDQGRQWTFLVDPTDSRILYTNSGYGAQGSGAFKSIDGGVNWTPIWPPPAQFNPPALSKSGAVVPYDFVQLIAMDPSDHRHLLLSFHQHCNAPYTTICMAESPDGGDTWRVVNGDPNWAPTEAQYIYFLDNSSTWFWAQGSNGLWRTMDSGATWRQVEPNTGGHNFEPVYRAANGAYHLALNTGLYRSPDGVSWSTVINQPFIGIMGNGATLFAAAGFPHNPTNASPPWTWPAPYEPFWTSPESDGTQWTNIASPPMTNGGTVAYDAGHHILYSSNLEAGFWRVVTP